VDLTSMCGSKFRCFDEELTQETTAPILTELEWKSGLWEAEFLLFVEMV
jgi:hypothetical protein